MFSKAAATEAGFIKASAAPTLPAFAAGLVRMLRLARSRQRTARILQGLDDLALKDIGLSRGAVDAAFRDRRYDPRL